MAKLCDYCEEYELDDPQVCPGSKPYKYHGADACTGFSPVYGVRCCKCGEASDHMALVLGKYLVCFPCMEAFFGAGDAKLADLVAELEGLA